MSNKRPNSRGIAALIIYAIIYCLYVWKYSYSSRPFPELTLIIYGALAPIVMVLALSQLTDRFRLILTGRAYVLLITTLAVGFWILMSRFDPSTIQIGRYPALLEWNERLFAGQFPYQAHSRPSGFPFLFLLTAPLQLLGEVGLMQILGLLLFGWVVYSWCGSESGDRFRLLVLLAAAPITAFEVCVRSELIANAVMILAALELTRRFHTRKAEITPLWLGLFLGLAASTRGVFLPAYLTTLPLVLRQHGSRYNLKLLGSAVLGFALTLLPFIVWNWDFFWNYGPFSIQMSHIPAVLLATAFAVSLAGGLTVRSYRAAYFLTGAVLFGIVAVKMIMSLAAHGVAETIEFDNYFDMAYFGFCLPFVVLPVADGEQLL